MCNGDRAQHYLSCRLAQTELFVPRRQHIIDKERQPSAAASALQLPAIVAEVFVTILVAYRAADKAIACFGVRGL